MMFRRLFLPLFLSLALMMPLADPFAQSNARAVISAASSGNNTIIAGVTGKRIFIYGIDLSTASVTTVQFKSGASTALTGVMTLNAYSKGMLPIPPAYWVTDVGDAFVISLGSSVQMSGTVWYLQQ